MSGNNQFAEDVIPSACRFFRGVILDTQATDHDRSLIVEHTKLCASCKNAIGNMIHVLIQNHKQTGASGT